MTVDRDLGELGDPGMPPWPSARAAAAHPAPVSLAQVWQTPGGHRRQDHVESRIAPTHSEPTVNTRTPQTSTAGSLRNLDRDLPEEHALLVGRDFPAGHAQGGA